MTVKEMRCVYSAILNAKEIIEQLGSEDYPFTEIEDDDFSAMFYKLNRMCIKISQKINAAEKAANK